MYETPEAAETAFYEAFENTDLEAMMEVWAPDEAIVCVHPMGTRLSGREEVRNSWAAIFEGDSPLSFEITEVEVTAGEELAVHCVYEIIDFGANQRSMVIATNVYRLTKVGWRMCLHHGSPGQAQAEKPRPPRGRSLH